MCRRVARSPPRRERARFKFVTRRDRFGVPNEYTFAAPAALCLVCTRHDGVPKRRESQNVRRSRVRKRFLLQWLNHENVNSSSDRPSRFAGSFKRPPSIRRNACVARSSFVQRVEKRPPKIDGASCTGKKRETRSRVRNTTGEHDVYIDRCFIVETRTQTIKTTTVIHFSFVRACKIEFSSKPPQC